MNHAVVLAAQQFLGFELCGALLESGWTVTAIDDNDTTEEKWMEIGRNANIQYIAFSDWNREIKSEATLFLPYYDQLRGNKLQCLSEVDSILEEQKQLPNIVEIYSNRERKTSRSQGSRPVTTFYIPTLFGIHQPSSFLFAQLLNEDCEEGCYEYIDDTSGAIYVKDAAFSIISNSLEQKTFTLKPDSDNSWSEALSHITESTFSSEPIQCTPNKNILTVKPSQSYDEIIQEQKRGINREEI
ncbi:hypothetical protein [Rossellomorea aquimaris]|uniref:hypothetical protein n=1 Tax=Rossellomorea aquimaris TaxID=189382 RepID=UPI0007D08CEB|nr:hypothetical protein [Rossellomorea aquimaris]